MNVQTRLPLRVARRHLPFECVALVLQGGGALGAYQAGVYEALTEADIQPAWVAGVSIGAINAAIIAGKEPAERVGKLRAFWREITANPLLDWSTALHAASPRGEHARALLNQASAACALIGGGAHFFTPRQPVRIATATMGYKHQAADLAGVTAALRKPNFLLKIIPHVDGNLRICELVEYRLADIDLKEAWTGPAALSLWLHALAPPGRAACAGGGLGDPPRGRPHARAWHGGARLPGRRALPPQGLRPQGMRRRPVVCRATDPVASESVRSTARP